MIDDFCVETENDWSFIGEQLIEKIKPRAKSKGASQILVVCGAHDEPKRQFLRELGLNVASEWYISSI
ncbi:MAG: hypothetical protein ACEY3D_06125 [Rickettsia sp.]|uniref:hypothetical protein n=1 Tax=Rickettsia sp. TaxID=789 RepID=UPI00397DAFD2